MTHSISCVGEVEQDITRPVSRNEADVMALEEEQQQQQQQRQAEQLWSGLLEEEELFYVDLNSDNIDGLDSPCDYGHLGRMDHLVTTRLSIAEEKMPRIESESSGGDTETLSKTDSEYTNDLLDQAQGEMDECLGMPRLPPPPLPHTVTSSHAVTSRAKVLEEGAVDPCVAMFRDLHRAWGWLTGSTSHKKCENYSVEYLCQHWDSSTSFKYFGKFKSGVHGLHQFGVIPGTYTIQIARFRVVSTMWERFAEYEVCLVGEGRRWVSWKRFSNFKRLAASSSRLDHIRDTAWARVMMSRLHYRCLSPEYLAKKCRLLEMFLGRVMFAMPTPTPLVQFLTHEG